MKKKLILLSLALISCVCVMSGAAACSYDDEGNVTDFHIHDVPLTYVDAVDATCTTAGNKAYYTCESCGKYFADYDATTELSESDVVIAALGHDYTTTFEWAEDYSTATATRVCSHDATHTETVTAVITSDTTTAATCTETGTITYTATATFSDNKTATDTKTDTIPATGEHTYSTEWTNNTSYHWHVCTVCGETGDRAEHTYTAADGKATCSVCGYVANESLTLDTAKELTLINSGTDENGNYVTYSYLAYYASEAGEYSLELVAGNNSPILSMLNVVVSVNGTVATGSDNVYTVELAEGSNYIEIALTGTATVDPASENYTYTATLSAYVPLPTLSMGANTVSEEVTYEFTATDAGYYIFTVSGTKGWAYLYSADDLWHALYEEYYSDVDYYYTYLDADEVFALYVENGGDGDFVITITYSEGNPDPDAITTSVPATLALGDNAIALSSGDCDANLSSTFTATEAGTYTFSISGSSLGYASLVYKYTPSNRAIQVVYSDDPQLYTLEAGESITIYFYADNEAEYTFNIVFGDYVTTDDDYLKTGDYTIETTYDSDYRYYGYKAVYIIKTTGTYTFTLDTTATTGSEVIYFSNDGTLHDTAAELSLSGTTTASYKLTAGNSIYIYVYDYDTEVATTYVFNISLEGEEAPCEHSYEATWTWADDNTATVELVCSLCGDKQTVEATVTTETTEATCTVDGLTTYTATATYNGVEYTATDTETIAATGHIYGDPEWTWTGYTEATAKFTCSACNDEQTVTTTDITSTTTVEATCTTDGYIYYTATVTFNEKEYSENLTATIPATGHTYDDPVWTWSNDYSTATATFTCSTCGAVEDVTATITSETTDATCNDDGSIVYTATATFGEKEYTDTKTSAISSTGHTYGDPVWTWASDYSTATATFTCVNGDDTKTETATVTSDTTAAICTADGETVYTATVSFNGEEYTNTKTETIAATGHNYGEPAWTWASDYASATLTFTCGTCGGKQTFTVDSSSETDEDGNTVYTVTYTYEDETYTTTQKISAFDGTVYNMSSLSGTVKTGDELFDGFITAYTTSASSVNYVRYERSTASTPAALVEGQTLYEGVVLTHCIRMNGSASNERGIQFTLSENATVFIYYATNKTSSVGYLILTGDGGTYTIASDTGANTDIYVFEVQLTKGTYKLYAGATGAYDLFSIGVSYNGSTETCEHTYEATSWAWSSDYSRAVLTLTCSLCGDKLTFTVDSSSALDADGNTVYTVTYTYEGDGKTYTTTETVPAEDGYFVAGTYTVEPTLDEDYDDYRYSFEYTVKETGTYTIALDTTATTGSGTLYFSLDGTLHTLAAELSADGTTSAVCDLNAGGTIIVLLNSDADAYKYVFTVTYSELCDHSYTDTWDWAENYTSATVTLTCSNCGMIITATATSTSSTDDDGNTVYTVSYTYNGVTYSDSQTVDGSSSKTFDGIIYNMSSLNGTYSTYSGITIPATLFDGFVTTYTSGTATSLSYSDRSEYAELVDGQTLYKGVDLSYAISISYSKTKGIQFTLSEDATVILYYSFGQTSCYFNLTGNDSTYTITAATATGTGAYVYLYEVELTKGTYTLLPGTSSSYYLFSIGASGNASIVSGGTEENTDLSLTNGYTWDSKVGDTGAFVYNPTDYELTGGTEYTLTVKDSGVYTLTTGNSDVTFGTTTIGANTSVILDLYADEEYTVTAVSDVTLTAQYIDVTGNAYGTFDATATEYTFTEYSDSVTLAAGDTVYYRIDAASQDADENTSFNMYIYVSGDVDNVSVYYSNTQDSEANIAAKDSYELVSLTDGYYYITLAAKGHGYFKIVANSAATITVTLAEGGDGGDDSGDSGDSGITYVAMTLDDTMTLDLLDDGNGYYVVYLSYTAAEAGSYTLTLSGDHSWWTSGLAMITDGIKLTVNDGTAETTSTGVYTITLEEGYNTIVINYTKLGSYLATSFSYTATLTAA